MNVSPTTWPRKSESLKVLPSWPVIAKSGTGSPGCRRFGLVRSCGRWSREIEHQRSGERGLDHSQVNKPVILGLAILLLDL